MEAEETMRPMAGMEPKKPWCFKAASQKITFTLKDQHLLVKAAVITTVALFAISLIAVSLLSQYGILEMAAPLQWSLLGLGLATVIFSLIVTHKFRKTKSYTRDQSAAPLAAPLLDQDKTFLLRRPKWHSVIGWSSSGDNVRSKSPYHDWYTFLNTKENARQPQVCKADDPTLQIHWENGGTEQVVYRVNEGSDKEVLFRTTVPKSPDRYYYPYIDTNNNIYIVNQGNIVCINADSKEALPLVVPVALGEVVSTIRYDDGVLIVGYQSGLVQLFAVSKDKTTNQQIASVRSSSEILDAWVDTNLQQLFIVANKPYSWQGHRRRKIELWQF